MREVEMKRPLAVLTSDWHLQPGQPRCRNDDFQAAQWRKIRYILRVAQDLNVPVLNAGDLGHHWSNKCWTPEILSRLIRLLKKYRTTMFCAIGQHDLKDRNYVEIDQTGIGVLNRAQVVDVNPYSKTYYTGNIAVTIKNYGQSLKDMDFTSSYPSILITHEMVIKSPARRAYKTQEPSTMNARRLLNKYPHFDAILTGDNHKPFSYLSMDSRRVINPGSLTRFKADQRDHQPRFYIWYADGLKKIDLDVDPDDISREHIQKKEDRNAVIEAFADHVRSGTTASIDFKDNIRSYIQMNKVTKRTIKKLKEITNVETD
jgi:DNA repair exonuclease SbcCD nuclease subunit